MGVEFVLGRRKSGKSQYMTDIIKKHINSKEICYFLVPEQSTLETENKIITRLNSKGLFDVQVISFKKLGNLLLKNTDIRSRTFLNEQGQLLILNKIINELDYQLKYFKKAKPSTLEEINRVIGDLRDISGKELKSEKIINKPDLLIKIKELSLIKDKYQEYLKEGYIDDIAFNDRLLDSISESSNIKEAHFFIDDFYTFSNQQLKIVKELIRSAKTCTIALNIDVNNCEFNKISQNIYQNLNKFIDLNNLKNKTTVLEQQFFKSSEVSHLENILSYNKIINFEQKISDLKLVSFTNINEEVKNLFENIIKIVDQGYKYKDIKIVCNNIDAYRNYFKLYRKIYEVPLFINEKVFIHNHPIARLLLSMINLLDDNKTDDIINMLKTDFLDFDIPEVESLEKYVKENGINYNKWERKFDDSEIELVRQRVLELIMNIRINVQGSSIKEKISCLYQVLIELKVYEKLSENIEEFKVQENFKNVYLNTQFWNTLLEILDQMVGFLGDKDVNNNELQKLLKNSLEREFLSILPINDNEVMVINSQDGFKESAEVLFIVGANEGFLPERISPDPLFPLDESILLEEVLNWKKDDLSKQLTRNIELYFTLTIPNKALYISYSLSDSQGEGIKPAYILKSIRKSFNINYIDSFSKNNNQYFYSKYISLLNLIKSSQGGFLEISRNEYNNIFVEFGEFLDNLFTYNRIENNEGQIEKDIVRKILFNEKEPFFTISKLEEYGKCPYSFFIKYGINPTEEKEFEIKSMDIGNIYHHVLERIGKNNWYIDNVDENISKIIENHFFEEYQENNLLKFDSHQLSYRLNKIKDEGLNLVENLRNDIINSQFKPSFYEAEFGPLKTFPEYRLGLEGDQNFFLEGKVDRVDILKHDEKDFIRIIDYKLKGKKMDYRKFRDGIAFQLFVYLNALSNKNLIPAGVLYNSLVDDYNKDRITGLVVKAKDQDFLMPEGLKESSAIEPSEYELIRKFTDDKIKGHVRKIIKGDFKVAPYYYKNDESGCKYCKYSKICKNKKQYRVLNNEKYDKKSFIEELNSIYAKLD
ncbi:MAG: addB [Fusobacteria bacterium]|nr:MAG: addB [Fusobacteriota bacterium]KAF0229701.1 MAG: hypothetical protein FD182_91 [Fusobacteriota bacterium]